MSSFSGSASLPSSVLGGESLNWYSDRESPLNLRRSSGEEAAPRWPQQPEQQRKQRRLQQRRLGNWRTQPPRSDHYRAVKSHLDLPDDSEGYSSAASAVAAAGEALRRLAVGRGSGSETETESTNRIVIRLPPILLHSPGGKELDTDTSYQQSIREWKARGQLGLPPMRGSDEWRLPHAAVPARPDFSRRAPGAAASTHRERRTHSSATSLTAENISRLQDALAKRAADRLLGATSAAAAATPSEYSAFESELFWLSTGLRRIYMPFVESAQLHDKSCSPADRRAADYEFPGWCYGCRLQQGDHWHGHPSYNPLRDRPVRVGGGFAYFTRELLHGLSGGQWSAAAAAMESAASKDNAWMRAQVFGSVDDAVIRALAAHQQTIVPSRYLKLPDIAPSSTRHVTTEPASNLTPLSVISAGTVGGRRLSMSSDNSGGTTNDTSESIVGTTSDAEGSLAGRLDQQLAPRFAAAAEEKAGKRSSKKSSSRRRSLQDLAIVPLKKHISVIREQTELSVHHESITRPNELSASTDAASIGIEEPQSAMAANSATTTAAVAVPTSPKQLPLRAASSSGVPVVSERSVVVPRPVANQPVAPEAAGNADKYTVRVKLLDGRDGAPPTAASIHIATTAERQNGLVAPRKPTAAETLPSQSPQPPVELDTVALTVIDSGESEEPPSQKSLSPLPTGVEVAVESGNLLPEPTISADVSVASPAADNLGEDEAVDAGVVGISGDGDESLPLARAMTSAKKSAKGSISSADGLRKTLTRALQISNWKDPQALTPENVKVTSDFEVAPSAPSIQESDNGGSEPKREEPPSSGHAASSERAEEVIVHRIGARKNTMKKTAGARRGKIASIQEAAPRTQPTAEKASQEQQVSSQELNSKTPPLSELQAVDVPAPSHQGVDQPTAEDAAAASSVSEGDSAPDALTRTSDDTDEPTARTEDAEKAAEPQQNDAEQQVGSESELAVKSGDDEMEAGAVSREPSSLKRTPPARRTILPSGPPKKPNFMHLLTLAPSTEDDEIPVTPPRSPTPEFDFEIERESPVYEEDFSNEEIIISQPLPRIRYATSPSPVPPPAVAREPTPKPREPTPEPIVVRRRPRKTLDTFLHDNRGPRIPKRPEVVQPLTKKELQGIGDPLDYLSQFCLIRLDKLPYYEKVFREVVSYQQPRFQTEELPPLQGKAEPSQTAKKAPQSVHEQQQSQGRAVKAGKTLAAEDTSTRASSQTSAATRPPLNYKLLRSFAKLMSVPEFDEPAINIGEFHVRRITFAMHKQYEKYDRLMQAAEILEAHRDRALADLAKKKHADVLHPKPTGGETDGAKALQTPAKAKAADQLPNVGPRHLAAAEATTVPRPKLSDGEVLQRLPPAVMEELLQDAAVRSMTIRLTRLEERIAIAEQRLAQLQEERQEMEVWAREVYEAERFPADAFNGLLLPQDDGDVILQHLHPSEDDEMNLEELEYALRLVNNQLITHRELMYVYHILKIPGRRRINLKTFCCISALSEKVQELDPLVRDLINAFDYEALEIKMQVCKELFYMLADKSGDALDGAISIRTLAAELIAGGISRENLGYIINKLDFRRKGYIEYLDFLVYIPLFFEIHRRIIANPLSDHRQSYGGFRRHLSLQE